MEHKRDNEMDVESQLQLIESIVVQCQKAVREDGSLFVLWGLLAVTGSLLSFGAGFLRLPGWVFAIIWGGGFLGIGLPVTIRHIRARSRRVRTFGERVLGHIWMGILIVSLAVCLLLVFHGFLLGTLENLETPGPLEGYSKAVQMLSLIIIPLLLGAAYFPFAVLLDWKPFYLFGSLWILAGILMLLVEGLSVFLVFDMAILVCEVLPGLLLRKRTLGNK